LAFLPCEDISQSWPEVVGPQRELYTSLVEQYLEGPLDPGRELRSQLSKTLRNRALRKNYNRLQRLDHSSNGDESEDDDDEDGDDSDDEDGNNDDGVQTNSEDDSDSVGEGPTMPPTTTATATATNNRHRTIAKIADQLPPQFKDQWKRSGISLDNRTVATVASSTATALGINYLNVPDFTEDQQVEFQLFLEDAKLLEEIRKDVQRTHPDLYFFLEPKENLGLRRYAAIERVLFVWSKLNKGVRIFCILLYYDYSLLVSGCISYS
jgi:hypothetical protein